MASGIKHRIEDYKTSLSRLSSRERTALGGLGVAVLLVVALVVGYIVYSGLEELEQQNAAIRTALTDLQRHGSRYMKQRRRVAALEVRMARSALDLNTFVEQAAKGVGVEILESSEIQPVDVDRYTQRGLEVKLRKIGIEQLGKLMKALENSPHIVQITRLSVSTRWKQHKDLDVDMVVSTYERRQEAPAKKPSGGRGRKGRKRS